MVIYLDEYRKARAIRRAVQDRNGEEPEEWVNTGAVATVSAIFFQRPAEFSPELPEETTSIELDKVLDRIRALASQF